MAVLLTQTRQEIRADIGYNMGSVFEGTATASGSASTLVDTNLKNSDNLYNDMQIIFTSGTNNDGQVRFISDYVGSTGTITIRGDDLTDATADGDTYELWDRDMPIARIHSFINRAVRMYPRKGGPLTEITTHSSRELHSYDVATAMTGVEKIEYRKRYGWVDLSNCDSVWSELVDTDVTLSQDQKSKREGSASMVLELADALSAGDIAAAQSIGSQDLRGMTHVEGWIWTDTALTAAQLQLILSASASAGTETELISIPAITSTRTWTRFRVALANPEDDGAIISLGLKHTEDIGAATVKLDGIIATTVDDELWETLNWNYWGVNRDQRKFFVTEDGWDILGHNMLRLTGRQKPTLLNADGTSCDISSEWIIQKASALALHARADRSAERRKAAAIDAERFDVLAQLAARRIQGPGQIRWLSD